MLIFQEAIKKTFNNFPNKRRGNILTKHPRQGGRGLAYFVQGTFLPYREARITQKEGAYSGGGVFRGECRFWVNT